jgi:hypothetical protein
MNASWHKIDYIYDPFSEIVRRRQKNTKYIKTYTTRIGGEALPEPPVIGHSTLSTPSPSSP